MKKTLLIIFSCIACFSYVSAQKTTFGIKAGANISSVEINDGDDYDSKVGIHGGALAHIHISRHFAVQPEVVFSMQGGEFNNGKLKLNYVNVPVLVQYMFDQGFRLQTGPQLGILVGAEQKSGNLEIDVDDAYNTVDFSWSFGAGYLFPAGIGIDARYNLGINDIAESPNYEARNRVFQIGLFYQFMNNK